MRRRRKLNLPLIEVIVVSLLVHVVGLLVLGGITIWTALQPEEPELEAPPVMEQPQEKLQQRVRLERQQKKSSRPRAKIAVKNISQINLPNLDVNLPTVGMQVAVGGAGAGTGLGRGFGSGGIDFTKSAVDFFGIKDEGENVAFILDTARSMVEKRRGDVAGYDRVKEEIGQMIMNMNPGTLFNIYAFDDNIETFRPRPVAASAANRSAANKWISQFWEFQNGKFTKQGAVGFDNAPDMTGLPIRRQKLARSGQLNSPDATFDIVPLPPERAVVGEGSSRVDLAILAAAEGGADTIFMITDGTPMVMRAITQDDLRNYRKQYADYWRKAEGDPGYIKWQEEMKAFHKKIEAIQEERRRKGLPPEIREGGYIRKPPNPPKDIGWPPGFWFPMKEDQLFDMIAKRVRDIYRSQSGDMPPLHVVGYAVGEEEEASMKALQKPFRGGQFRNISGTELLKDDRDDPPSG